MNKDGMHIAKLSLLNMRLLGDIDAAATWCGDIRQLKHNRCVSDSVREPVSLLHQGAFLGHAYVCLVWLRELVKKDSKADNAYIDGMTSRFEFSEVKKVSGPREISKPNAKLRLIRNAISHARVKCEDDRFLFADIDLERGEDEETVASVTWAGVGMLCDSSLFTVNDILYPQNHRLNHAGEPVAG